MLALEERLDALRYDVGKVDGKFDWQTWQGVVAFQKVNGLDRTGKAGSETQAAMAGSAGPVGALVPNGGKDFPAKITFLEALERFVGAAHASGKKLVLCGDLNVARTVMRLGEVPVTAYGFAGGHVGAILKSMLDAEKVPHDFIDSGLETRINLLVSLATDRALVRDPTRAPRLASPDPGRPSVGRRW